MAKRKYEVLTSERAERMLLEHIEFLARVSPAAASRLIVDSKKVRTRLADNPYRFQFADGLDVPGVIPMKYRKCLFGKRYKALFYIIGNDVYIDAFIDCRQENDALFDKIDK